MCVQAIAIYHCSMKIVSRGKGKSAVAAAAYRSGEKLTNEWDGMTHDYTHKGGVVHSEILLPPDAPPSFSDRSQLWNSVELCEKSNNAQLAREMEISLPVELTREEQTNIDIASTLDTMRTSMEAMGVGELLGLAIETLVISLCLKIMSILITVILYGRMIEIYCTVSIAPIPIATMSNREWGSIGTNYLKGLFALAFQGFLIMICVGIYAVLINNMIIAANIHSALFSVAAYTVILCFSLFKTGSLSKSLFNAH